MAIFRSVLTFPPAPKCVRSPDAGYELIQSALIYRNNIFVQLVDAIPVFVDTGDIPTKVGKADGGNLQD
jgi:hypothetical protein